MGNNIKFMILNRINHRPNIIVAARHFADGRDHSIQEAELK